MSNFGGRLSQPKKTKLFLGTSFFCQHNLTGGGIAANESLGRLFFNFETKRRNRRLGKRKKDDENRQ
jgi:hypothetical protein